MTQNLKNYYSQYKYDLRLSKSDYWDFYLTDDHSYIEMRDGDIIGEPCLVAHYDFNNQLIYSGSSSANTIYSLTTWDKAINSGVTINHIGLTGIDNGLITFNKTSGDTSNVALLNALTGSTLSIQPNETRLMLHKVTGMTGDYIYPSQIEVDPNLPEVGEYLNLCGGFYQGFYKLDGYDYQVLPTRVPKAWVAEFWVRKREGCVNISGTTLNDLYPDNKGFFFYMGTRAENKFWNIFNGLNTGCTSGCTQPSGCTDTVTNFCTTPKETEIFLSGGTIPIPLSPPPIEITETDNNFLIYHRGKGGELAPCYSGGSIIMTGITMEKVDNRNPFLIYSRSNGKSICGGKKISEKGETVCSYSGDSKPLTELDYKLDVIDNAIGFRIKDDGSIGYRMLTVTGTCIDNFYYSGVSVVEEYSVSGTVTNDEWQHIAIKWVANKTYDECELEYKKPRKGRLMFYVGCYLKFVVEDFPEFIARRLNEYKDKQLGVGFNISLGGGSQGLLESMTFDGQDPDDLGLDVERNFAGTFIGDISQFRFYICNLSWCDLKYHCSIEGDRYYLEPNLNFVVDEFDNYVIHGNGFGIIF
jgi:hypothetical protein